MPVSIDLSDAFRSSRSSTLWFDLPIDFAPHFHQLIGFIMKLQNSQILPMLSHFLLHKWLLARKFKKN
jgi:hypothetical protein